ncbi:hypothetical protein AOQ84DRAFT_410114 [Glonium stellatum]|uniref:Uncharacterized protein n=1 Tax=Glonium stellatum TaxID=574774 RepID=A0A8E2JRH1_9PEZI|nr:hypothetical protein AOQ84DRAFT_410114 [Glonium stellatum]
MLCLNKWIYILRKETYAQDAQLREVQIFSGLMEDKTASDADKSDDLSMGEAFHEAHATIVVMHNVLADTLVSFLQESSRDLKLALGDFKRIFAINEQSILGNINEEFEGCLKQLDMVASGLMHMRERLLNRMDMQLKVLYNLMQQRDSRISQNIVEQSTKIAVASKRDSSAMKAIAVLTMLFLPGTAVASIFSMGSFFSAADNSRVAVSSQFWLYWAVVLPLTGVVLTVWLSWLRVEKIRARREEDEQVEGGVGWGSRSSLTVN